MPFGQNIFTTAWRSWTGSPAHTEEEYKAADKAAGHAPSPAIEEAARRQAELLAERQGLQKKAEAEQAEVKKKDAEKSVLHKKIMWIGGVALVIGGIAFFLKKRHAKKSDYRKRSKRK